MKSLYPGDRYKLRNTTIHFANGMTLWVAGAYNKSNLQRRSIRWLIGDETWRWPQGHMAKAEARPQPDDFHNKMPRKFLAPMSKKNSHSMDKKILTYRKKSI